MLLDDSRAMIHLSDRTAQVLAFIEREVRTRQRPPTLKEIATHFGMVSTNGARHHLVILEKHGKIKRDGSIARGISIVNGKGKTDGKENG